MDANTTYAPLTHVIYDDFIRAHFKHITGAGEASELADEMQSAIRFATCSPRQDGR